MSKPNLLLLHGALGAKSQFLPLIPFLDSTYSIHSLDFEGHGTATMVDRPFRREHFVENVIHYSDANGLNPIDIFGYSMGGQVALDVADVYPEKVNKVFTLATKFLWTPEFAAHEVAFLDPDKILKKVPQLAKELEERHMASDWRMVLTKTKEMFLDLGKNKRHPSDEMGHISHPVRIGIGDRDTMVSIEESIEVYRSLPNGELQIFPATPHPLEKVSIKNLSRALFDFF